MKFKFPGVLVVILLAASFPASGQYAGFYVLDGYGGVHAGGGAAAISPITPYFGWDIAKDIAFIPVAYSDSINGDGYLVLDGYGGIHWGGKLASISVAPTPYFGWNIARAVDFRRIDPQAYGTATNSWLEFYDNNIHTVAGPINMVLPDGGYVLVTGNIWVTNNYVAAGQWLIAHIGIGVNSETQMDAASIKGCTLEPGWLGPDLPSSTVAVSRMFYFPTSGTQRFYLLATRHSTTGGMRLDNPCFNAVYFNKRWDSYSMSPGDEDSTLAPNNYPGMVAPELKK